MIKIAARKGKKGDAKAQMELGWCYETGASVTKDGREAAAQNQATVQNNLGFCYQYGQGVEKDLDLALTWYEKAVATNEAVTKESGISVPYRIPS